MHTLSTAIAVTLGIGAGHCTWYLMRKYIQNLDEESLERIWSDGLRIFYFQTFAVVTMAIAVALD